jgi:hypothetical protein
MGRDVQLFGGLVGLAAVAALAGCDGMANTRVDFSTTEKVAITEIRVSGGSGDVVVHGSGPAGEVRIDRVVRYRGSSEPGKTYRLAGSVLSIDTDCGRFCGVSYEIEAPRGVAVRGDNGSGDITLSDVSAVDIHLGSGSISVTNSSEDVAVETGSGDITVSAVAGNLTAEAGSGSVDARGVVGPTATVRTGSGDLTVVRGRPGSVTASAGSGSIEVLLPDGRYRIDASTDSGDKNVQVPDDPTATNTIRIDSGSGDVTVSGG